MTKSDETLVTAEIITGYSLEKNVTTVTTISKKTEDSELPRKNDPKTEIMKWRSNQRNKN